VSEAPAEELVLDRLVETDVVEIVVEVVVTLMSLSRASNLKLVSLKDLEEGTNELA
jgi:hypothetical protein